MLCSAPIKTDRYVCVNKERLQSGYTGRCICSHSFGMYHWQLSTKPLQAFSFADFNGMVKAWSAAALHVSFGKQAFLFKADCEAHCAADASDCASATDCRCCMPRHTQDQQRCVVVHTGTTKVCTGPAEVDTAPSKSICSILRGVHLVTYAGVAAACKGLAELTKRI